MVKDWFKLGLVTRAGKSPTQNIENIQLSSFSYINSQTSIPGKDIKFITGAYYVKRPWEVQETILDLCWEQKYL